MLVFKDNVPFSEIVEYIKLFTTNNPTPGNELTATNNPICLNELKISIQPKELERAGENNEENKVDME